MNRNWINQKSKS